MSKAIKRLELSFDVELFVRSTRKVTLTRKGEAVLAHAESILANVERLHGDLAHLENRVAGALTIGAMEVFSTELIPSALAELVREHPSVTPRCYEIVPQEMERLIAEGRCDVGFTIGGGRARGVDYNVVGRSPGVIACGRTHPLYGKGRLGVREAGKFPFVVPEFRGRENEPSLDQFPQDLCPRVVGATIELMQTGIELCVQGAYLGYFPEVSVRGALRDGRLRALRTTFRGEDFELRVLTRRSREASPACAKLIELVAQRLASNRTA